MDIVRGRLFGWRSATLNFRRGAKGFSWLKLWRGGEEEEEAKTERISSRSMANAEGWRIKE